MTDKCRRRMNRREGYITTEISQRMGDDQEGEGGPEKGRRLLCDREGLAHSRPRVRVPSPWDVGPPDSVYFSLKNKLSPHQSPTF